MAMNFILCADLHLKESEKNYCFSVLNEILKLCEKKKCEALLFAGDVFDSREAVKALRPDFRSALETLDPACSVYFLPGNHEELYAQPSEGLESFDFGRARLLAKKPWSLHTLGADAELLAMPFQRDYSGYRDWGVPPKKNPVRILLAHGTMMSMAYAPSVEETDSIIDEDMFNYFQVDIAALGHLHKQAALGKGSTLAAYPGSARVWREGEEGKRCVLLGNTGAVPPALEKLTIASAGEYRIIRVYASADGKLRAAIPELISPGDWIHLELAGVVEEEPPVLAALEKLKTDLMKKCRRVTSTESLTILSGISTHPLARRFLRAWEEAAPEYKNEEPGVYEQARLKGLLALKDVLEKSK